MTTPKYQEISNHLINEINNGTFSFIVKPRYVIVITLVQPQR
ncbi:hypothetical protein [Xylocopilactobacillus apis]|uniref:Uncharacterized protein n=1 Tax=Xylocopilactobacillus apis TaxID=2932183 RepID=A0AAU9CTY5_9LACO|nr:hypothetical protein [Xylocopilactobacillus apis]BDR57464.1 hypothetical protein KIMC2_20260 [Xylocopilactobacillus apis]BDR57513.1 hypothetical protein KIMC2_20750 [Xylocopilactobacillus apis]